MAALLLGPHKVAPCWKFSNTFREVFWAFWAPIKWHQGPKSAKNSHFWRVWGLRCHFLGAFEVQIDPSGCVCNVQLCSNRAIGGAYGQKWAFSSKNGRFRSLGPPGATFWGAQRPKQTTLDVLYNVQPCPTYVQPIWICWRCLWPKMAFLDPN